MTRTPDEWADHALRLSQEAGADAREIFCGLIRKIGKAAVDIAYKPELYQLAFDFRQLTGIEWTPMECYWVFTLFEEDGFVATP